MMAASKLSERSPWQEMVIGKVASSASQENCGVVLMQGMVEIRPR